MNRGAADMAAAIGINYLWDAPAVRNVEEQIDIINKAVDAGADALLVAADDPLKIMTVIEDAKARGVKVIYVDSPTNEEAITTLATDNYNAGVIAGETMIAILDKRDINSGYIGIISVGNKGNAQLRDEGFRTTLGADGRFILLDTEYTNGNAEIAQKKAEGFIVNISDLVALYGTNEGTSVGVGNAIKANDNQVVGVGFDKTDAMIDLLQNGSLQAIINQNPYTMGFLGIAQAVAALRGKSTGPDFLDTGISVIE